MPMYAQLQTWTQFRAEKPEDLPRTTAMAMKMMKDLGIEVKAALYTMGRYDVVAIFEAPSDEAATKAALAVGKLGAVRTETLRGYTYDEFSRLIKELPKP